MTDESTPRLRGFANMSPERLREASAKGGRAGKDNPNRPWARNTDDAREASRLAAIARRKKRLTPDTDSID